MTYDERIAQVVEMAFNAELNEEASVVVNEAIRVATEVNAELDDIWEDYNTMKTKYDYVVGLVGHLEEMARMYRAKAKFYYEQAKSMGIVGIEEEFEGVEE
jgi:hypothetical protein